MLENPPFSTLFEFNKNKLVMVGNKVGLPLAWGLGGCFIRAQLHSTRVFGNCTE